MTSDGSPTEAFVWVWLPGATDPVVAGRLEASDDIVFFNYGASYLTRSDGIPLYDPELPLRSGRIRPLDGMRIAGCISDAGPDAWGQRVILHRLLASVTRNTDPDELSPLTYLLESGSDRIGALDFQTSATDYVPRSAKSTLEEMLLAAERLEAGEPLSPTLEAALLAGSSAGGARPKVLLEDHGRHLIAKFSSRTDTTPVVKAEAAAMKLAAFAGLNVAPTELIDCVGHDVLLVDRFDRTAVPGERKLVVSALTLLTLDEMFGHYATYPDLADVMRQRFTEPAATLRELFTRIVFNICVGNTDDHARNHAALWDGAYLTLTPAYDISPQPRSGGESTQAMAIGPDNSRFSKFTTCVNAANVYSLTPAQAREIVDRVVDVVREHWDEAADLARLTHAERLAMWGRQILNPYAFED